MLIDTHCHLDSEYFPEGADETIERARSAGVTGFVCIGVGSAAQARSAIDIARRRPDVWATLGVHPHDAAACDAALETELRALAVEPRVVAIGEVGLDFHYDHSPRERQAEIFRRFIQWARELKKPLVIHTRSAPDETLRILAEENARDVGGIIHCFSEDKPFAERALDLGFYLSFSGIVTFKRSLPIQEVAAWAPADRILVETDSPYLAPVPLRGKRCEPAYVLHTARHVAELRGISLEQLAQQTSQNAAQLLGVSTVLN
jgi:TatD DNase family protein